MTPLTPSCNYIESSVSIILGDMDGDRGRWKSMDIYAYIAAKLPNSVPMHTRP